MSMGESSGRTGRAAINVTPLIDVLLVLLIIFMVIQPVTVRGLDALVPHAPRNAASASNERALMLEVLASPHGKEPAYRLNGEPVDRQALSLRLANAFTARQDRTLFVQGDAGLDYGVVADAVDLATHAGADNIGILTPGAHGRL